MPRPLPRTLRTAAAGALVALLAVGTLSSSGGAAQAEGSSAATTATTTATAAKKAGNVVTPGDFSGYGFDQCLAPDQQKMNKWRRHSPFMAVGIYISGDSRACRSQPNLTPAWISTQLKKGWRLLPITLGPQASCQPRFPRYKDDVTISAKPGASGSYAQARAMGTAEASKTVTDAQALGIVAGSTLWYDLEGFDNKNTDCRESALAFLSTWTERLHALGYVSGVYSSAGSGIAELDRARTSRPGVFTMPDRIWVARWDGIANTSTSYIAEDGWRPGGRVKQYQGGHDEVWGGVRINIDRNYLELGATPSAAAENHCAGTTVDYANYRALKPATSSRTPDAGLVKALQCLLKEKSGYDGPVDGSYSPQTVAWVRAWQAKVGHPQADRWNRQDWVSLLAAGSMPIVKVGSTGEAVRRLQRALNAASMKSQIVVDGVFRPTTETALLAWQAKVGLSRVSVANGQSWKALAKGTRRR